MCGIAGQYGVPTVGEKELEGISRALSHRGPDGHGFYFDKEARVGLAHRRLSILDLSDVAAQPMTYEDSGLQIVFNGEIYNYIELRTELQNLGYRFRTQSDTEVILAAFLEWDVQAFERMNGMWAMALYDQRKRRLILCVDRFQVKPLYVYHVPEGLFFASEQKAFFSLPSHLRPQYDEQGLCTALLSFGGLECAAKTIYKNIETVPGGHYLEIAPQGHMIKQWWNTADHLDFSASALSYEEQCEQFRSLFLDACRLRLRSDVPVATALSGGIDSTAVAAAISKVATAQELSRYRVFSHEFPGTEVNEIEFAKAAAKELSLSQSFVRADDSQIVKELDRILFYFESIYPGIPDGAWRIHESQRHEGYFVSIDGHGADELLGGYHQHHFDKFLENPARMREAFQSYRAQSGTFFSWKGFSAGVIKATLKLPEHLPLFAVSKRLLDPVSRCLHPTRFMTELYTPRSLEIPQGFDRLNRTLYRDFHQRVLPRILRNFDAMSMAHGVEVRSPFLDYRLVNFSFSLPSSVKLGKHFSKQILRDSMRGLMPEVIRTRKTKMGFNSPLKEWMPSLLRPWIEETLNSPNPLDGFIDRLQLRHVFHTRICTNRMNWNEAARFWNMISALRLAHQNGR